MFLDEIGDMDYRSQAKLLRFLEDESIEPVGSNRRITVDVRIVSSTNRDLQVEMRNGRFREDLFHRLNVFRIHLPPLRDRESDVPALATAFLAQFGRELGKATVQLDAPCMPLLQRYSWPGNVRELRNLMERAAVLATGDRVDERLVRGLLPEAEAEAAPSDLDLDRAVAEVERRTILRALAATGDDKAAAATLLGIGERTLWSKLKKHGI